MAESTGLNGPALFRKAAALYHAKKDNARKCVSAAASLKPSTKAKKSTSPAKKGKSPAKKGKSPARRLRGGAAAEGDTAATTARPYPEQLRGWDDATVVRELKVGASNYAYVTAPRAKKDALGALLAACAEVKRRFGPAARAAAADVAEMATYSLSDIVREVGVDAGNWAYTLKRGKSGDAEEVLSHIMSHLLAAIEQLKVARRR